MPCPCLLLSLRFIGVTHHTDDRLLSSLRSLEAFSRPVDTGCRMFTGLSSRQCTCYGCRGMCSGAQFEPQLQV
jgi:hypothetical protein